MDAARRRFVNERAGHRCEYCRLHRDHQAAVALQIEHIIARQHKGDDSLENLALACLRCNLHKGTNLVGRDPESGAVTRLFHPRQPYWPVHIELCGGHLIGRTAIGRTTAALFQMNTPDRIELRQDLIVAGLWK
jgi:hypothetical protein